MNLKIGHLLLEWTGAAFEEGRASGFLLEERTSGSDGLVLQRAASAFLQVWTGGVFQ